MSTGILHQEGPFSSQVQHIKMLIGRLDASQVQMRGSLCRNVHQVFCFFKFANWVFISFPLILLRHNRRTSCDTKPAQNQNNIRLSLDWMVVCRELPRYLFVMGSQVKRTLLHFIRGDLNPQKLWLNPEGACFAFLGSVHDKTMLHDVIRSRQTF